MPLPSVVIQLPIPGSLWRRWQTLSQDGGPDVQTVLIQLLEGHLGQEEQHRGMMAGFDFQI